MEGLLKYIRRFNFGKGRKQFDIRRSIEWSIFAQIRVNL